MGDADKKTASDSIPALKLDYVNDDCCIVQVKQESTTAGGLVIPDSAQDTNTGLILAHGYNIGINDEDDDPIDYVGQVAVFVPGCGKKMKINGVEVVCLHKAELIGIHVV